MDNLPNVGEVTSEEKAGLYIPPDHCTCDERKAKVMDVVDELRKPVFVQLDGAILRADYEAAAIELNRRMTVAAKRLQEIFA